MRVECSRELTREPRCAVTARRAVERAETSAEPTARARAVYGRQRRAVYDGAMPTAQPKPTRPAPKPASPGPVLTGVLTTVISGVLTHLIVRALGKRGR